MSKGGYWQSDKSLAETNKIMLETRLGADTVFEVGEEVSKEGSKKFHAHKYMLVSRSPVFETMFHGSIVETADSIRIPDVHPTAFSLLLQFIYSEEVDFDDIEVAVFTVYAAKKYMVNRLTKMAVKFILDHITVENVCLVLEHCKGLDEDHIVSKCYDFINQNAALIIVKDAFALLSEASVINILKSDSVNVLEESLISGLLSWGRMQLVKGGNSAKANDDKMIKNEIKDFLSYIRFPLVSYAKLMELNAQYDLLEASEKDHIHEYQCGKIFPSQCKYNVKLRGCRSITRFSLSDDFALLNLVRKEEIVKRKFHLDFWPQKPNFTLVAINIMNGPYLVRVLVYDHNNQLVSYTQRDFSSWPEQESCKEMTFVLQEPVECEISDEPYKIEVYLGKSNIMFWYDNVIVGKFSGNNDLKIKFYNPEILSKIHYLLG